MLESYQSPYLPPYDGGNEGGMMESYQGEDGLMLQRENAQQQYFDYAERQGTKSKYKSCSLCAMHNKQCNHIVLMTLEIIITLCRYIVILK